MEVRTLEDDVDSLHTLVVFWLLRACKSEVCRSERKRVDLSGAWLPVGWCIHPRGNFPEATFELPSPAGAPLRILRVRALSCGDILHLHAWLTGGLPRRLAIR